MPAALDALADPSRRRILELLRSGERPVGELVAELGLSQPGVSKHLRLLRQRGLVDCRVAGRQHLYRLRLEPLAELDQWLAPYRALWASSLDRLAGTPTDEPPWQARFEAYVADFEGRLGPQQGPPPGAVSG